MKQSGSSFLSTPLLGRAISFFIPSNIIGLHLPATVGEDNEEEVGGEEPARQVEHQVQGGQAEGRLEHVEKVQDQAHAIEDQPGSYVAGIFLQKEFD